MQLARSCCVLVFALLLVRVAAADAPATQPAAAGTQPASSRQLHLRMVRADTGAPVPNGRVGISGNGDDRNNRDPLTFDEHGEIRIPLSPEAQKIDVFYTAEGFVSGDQVLGSETGQPIPLEYTIRVRPGVAVGGKVVDEAGKPVAGVRVQLSFFYSDAASPYGRSGSHGTAETDAAGNWTYKGAPPETVEADIFARHPDFVMASFSQRDRRTAFDSLRRNAHVSRIRRGVSVEGVVLDPDGKPVAHAEVGPDGFGLISCVRTDAAGKFRLRGVATGKGRIAVKAANFAPLVREVEFTAQTPPVELRLEKGREMTFQVVDKDGAGIASVYISGQGWPDGHGVSIGSVGKTGADGRLKWEGAPGGQLSFSLYKQGYQRAFIKAVADGKEHRQVMQPLVLRVIKGTAVDAETGKAIDGFSVRVMSRQEKSGLSSEFDLKGSGGKFEVEREPSGDTFTLRAEADDYLPEESPLIQPAANGPITYDFKLRRGVPLTGTIQQPDGKPAAGADVLIFEGMIPSIHNGKLDRRGSTSIPATTTDAAGAFKLPPRGGGKDKLAELFVLHESGWAEAPHSGGAMEKPIVLRPWCTVSGVLMKGDKPWAGQVVRLNFPMAVPNGRGGYSLRHAFHHETITDPAGRFTLTRAADGRSALTVGDRELEPILSPGEQLMDLRIGGSGQTVVGVAHAPEAIAAIAPAKWDGHLRRVEPELIKPPGWENLPPAERRRLQEAFEQTPAYRRYASDVHSIAITREKDDTFRIDDVPPGDYTLWMSVNSPAPDEPNYWRSLANIQKAIAIGQVPAGHANPQLDLGTLELKLVNHDLKVGDAAPPLEAPMLDGKPLRLSDYAGKYVLLDFWATWCGPCVAEHPTLRQIWEKHKASGRFALIALSQDTTAEAPAQFAEAKKLPWIQAHVGASSRSSALQDYGVQGIPSTWLIDPKGKIIAKDLSGPKLAAAVDQALAGRQDEPDFPGRPSTSPATRPAE